MYDSTSHDKLIAKIQHFSNVMVQARAEKEILLLTIDRDQACEKDRLKNQIFLLEELSKEYYAIFDDILYR